MSEILRIIEEQHPLELDYESDARYIWPKRWGKVAERIAELEEKTSPRHSIPLEDFLGPLKPCPFCGSVALERDGFEEFITCKNCGGSAPVGGWQFRAPVGAA